MAVFKHRVGNQIYSFPSLRELLAKATTIRAGDSELFGNALDGYLGLDS